MSLELFSDSSLLKWGGIVHLPQGMVEISVFWAGDERNLSIMSLEARAFFKCLKIGKRQHPGA